MDTMSFLSGALSVVGALYGACAVYGAVMGYKVSRNMKVMINDLDTQIRNTDQGIRMDIQRTIDSRFDKLESRLSKVESFMNNN